MKPGLALFFDLLAVAIAAGITFLALEGLC